MPTVRDWIGGAKLIFRQFQEAARDPNEPKEPAKRFWWLWGILLIAAMMALKQLLVYLFGPVD